VRNSVQMQRTSANTKCTHSQADFALCVKMALLKSGKSMKRLAQELGLSRNTVSLAVNRGLYAPTRERIAEHLKIQ